MKNTPEKRTWLVRRITIDEKLADGLMRILVANLKSDVTTFDDDSKYWEEEKELAVQPGDYQEKMRMTQANVEKWLWKNLCEGQVFLQGGFREIPEKGAEATFVVDTDQRNFQRIDYLSKYRVKKVYMNALERSITNGEIDRTR